MKPRRRASFFSVIGVLALVALSFLVYSPVIPKAHAAGLVSIAGNGGKCVENVNGTGCYSPSTDVRTMAISAASGDLIVVSAITCVSASTSNLAFSTLTVSDSQVNAFTIQSTISAGMCGGIVSNGKLWTATALATGTDTVTITFTFTCTVSCSTAGEGYQVNNVAADINGFTAAAASFAIEQTNVAGSHAVSDTGLNPAAGDFLFGTGFGQNLGTCANGAGATGGTGMTLRSTLCLSQSVYCNGCSDPGTWVTMGASTSGYIFFAAGFPLGAATSRPTSCTLYDGAVIGTQSSGNVRNLVANTTYLYYAESLPFSGLTISNISLKIQGIAVSGSVDARVKLTLGIYEVQPMGNPPPLSSWQQPAPVFFPLVLLGSTILNLPSTSGQVYLSPTQLNGIHIDPARIWAISIAAQHTGVTVWQTTSNVNFLNDQVVENTPQFIYSVTGNPVKVSDNTPMYFYAFGKCDNTLSTLTTTTTCTVSLGVLCTATTTIFTVITSTGGPVQYPGLQSQNLWLPFLLMGIPLVLLLPSGLGIFGALTGAGAGVTFAVAFGLWPPYILLIVVAGALIAILRKGRGDAD